MKKLGYVEPSAYFKGMEKKKTTKSKTTSSAPKKRKTSK